MKNLPTVQAQIPSGMIDLGLGDPPLDLLPLEMIRSAAQARLSRDDPACLQYGAEQGDGHFRLALAAFLCKGYGIPVDIGELFVSAGVSSGLDLICSLFTRPGETVFVEEPSYFLALRIFGDHGLHAVPIPTDEDGLVIEALEAKLKETRPKFLYTVPTFQNPTGRTLSHARRAQLAALSREYDFLVLADEVYHFLSYGLPPPQAMAVYAPSGGIVSLGSFSKILAPGLRLGWIQAGAKVIQRLVTCGLLDSGGGMNPFTSAIVRGLLETGALEANIAHLTSVYRARAAAMEAALHRHLPGAEYTPPQGGFFFWVRLPGVNTARLQEKAEAFQVRFRPGVRFSSRDGLQEYMRLSHVFYPREQIEQGVMRLGRCMEV